ncbi:MAG TPA: hypothetical protein VL307_18010 [Chitinophagaceae bacterium]|nr:hypothetical protein [Chitinophagaceae bacterium]
MKATYDIEKRALYARLNIRDFFLNHITREVYENVGQVLSLVRLELATAPPHYEQLKQKMQSSAKLVEQSIKDLRLMTKNFHADEDVLQEGGFASTLKAAAAILYPNNSSFLQCLENADNAPPDVKLIVFDSLLQLLVILQVQQQGCKLLVATFTRKQLILNIEFTEDPEELSKKKLETWCSKQRNQAELMGGQCTIEKKRDGVNKVKIIIPSK